MDERRHAERQPPKGKKNAFVWTSPEWRSRVRVIDESPGGLGLIVATLQAFKLGMQVQVDYEDARRMATIVSVDERVDGRFRIGLAWDR